jgi:hypothetical protein
LPREYVQQRTEFFINVTWGRHRSRIRLERNGSRKLRAQFSGSASIPECTRGKIATGAHQLLSAYAVSQIRQRSEIQIWTLNASVQYFEHDFGLTIHERFRAKLT